MPARVVDIEATQTASMPRQMEGFVVLEDSFQDLISPSATLRLLLRSSDGLPIFHEAGVFLRESNTVYLSSNRIPSTVARQRATVTRVPLGAITSPRGTGILPSLEESDRKSHQMLQKELNIMHDLPAGLSMPNGGTNWSWDGQEAVLWCEQGRDDLDDDGVPLLPSSLTAMLPTPSNKKHKATKVLVDNYLGQPFSSLNDVVVHQQSGVVFFTDPDYGLGQSFKSTERQYAPNALYAWDPSSGQVTMIDDLYDKPNGVTFIPNSHEPDTGRGLLATTDTGRFFMSPNDTMGDFHVDETRPACIYTYTVEPVRKTGKEELPIRISERTLLAHSESPIPDGLHPDRQGNLWVGSGDGLHVYNPHTRSLIGKVLVPGGKGVANFCWAGKVMVYEGDNEDDDAPHQDGQEKRRAGRTMHRLLLFCEDELWEACVLVDGMD